MPGVSAEQWNTGNIARRDHHSFSTLSSPQPQSLVCSSQHHQARPQGASLQVVHSQGRQVLLHTSLPAPGANYNGSSHTGQQDKSSLPVATNRHAQQETGHRNVTKGDMAVFRLSPYHHARSPRTVLPIYRIQRDVGEKVQKRAERGHAPTMSWHSPWSVESNPVSQQSSNGQQEQIGPHSALRNQQRTPKAAQEGKVVWHSDSPWISQLRQLGIVKTAPLPQEHRKAVESQQISQLQQESVQHSAAASQQGGVQLCVAWQQQKHNENTAQSVPAECQAKVESVQRLVSSDANVVEEHSEVIIVEADEDVMFLEKESRLSDGPNKTSPGNRIQVGQRSVRASQSSTQPLIQSLGSSSVHQVQVSQGASATPGDDQLSDSDEDCIVLDFSENCPPEISVCTHSTTSSQDAELMASHVHAATEERHCTGGGQDASETASESDPSNTQLAGSDNAEPDSDILVLETVSLCEQASHAIIQPSEAKSYRQLSAEGYYRCGCLQGRCSFRTVLATQLELHLQEAHPEEDVYPCIHCGSQEPGQDSLLHHLQQHLTMQVFSLYCMDMHCQFSSFCPEEMIHHTTVHHSSLRTFMCWRCSSQFGSVQQLAAHVKQHLLVVFRCSNCSAKDVDRQSILMHIRSSHPDREQMLGIQKLLLCRERQLNQWEMCETESVDVPLLKDSSQAGLSPQLTEEVPSKKPFSFVTESLVHHKERQAVPANRVIGVIAPMMDTRTDVSVAHKLSDTVPESVSLCGQIKTSDTDSSRTEQPCRRVTEQGVKRKTQHLRTASDQQNMEVANVCEGACNAETKLNREGTSARQTRGTEMHRTGKRRKVCSEDGGVPKQNHSEPRKRKDKAWADVEKDTDVMNVSRDGERMRKLDCPVSLNRAAVSGETASPVECNTTTEFNQDADTDTCEPEEMEITESQDQGTWAGDLHEVNDLDSEQAIDLLNQGSTSDNRRVEDAHGGGQGAGKPDQWLSDTYKLQTTGVTTGSVLACLLCSHVSKSVDSHTKHICDTHQEHFKGFACQQCSFVAADCDAQSQHRCARVRHLRSKPMMDCLSEDLLGHVNSVQSGVRSPRAASRKQKITPFNRTKSRYASKMPALQQSQKPSISCNLCGMKGSSQTHMQLHLYLEHSKIMSCPICSANLGNDRLLYGHFCKQHPDHLSLYEKAKSQNYMSVVTSLDSERADQSADDNEHHTPCGNARQNLESTEKQGLDSSVEAHVDENVYNSPQLHCKLCPFSDCQPEVLRGHVFSEHKDMMKCPECGMQPSSDGQLYKHLSTAHSDQCEHLYRLHRSLQFVKFPSESEDGTAGGDKSVEGEHQAEREVAISDAQGTCQEDLHDPGLALAKVSDQTTKENKEDQLFTCKLCRFSDYQLAQMQAHVYKKHKSVMKCSRCSVYPGSDKQLYQHLSSKHPKERDLLFARHMSRSLIQGHFGDQDYEFYQEPTPPVKRSRSELISCTEMDRDTSPEPRSKKARLPCPSTKSLGMVTRAGSHNTRFGNISSKAGTGKSTGGRHVLHQTSQSTSTGKLLSQAHKKKGRKRKGGIYQCRLCPYSIGGKSIIYKHVFQQHPEVVQCSVCSRRLPSAIKLQQHIKQKHPEEKDAYSKLSPSYWVLFPGQSSSKEDSSAEGAGMTLRISGTSTQSPKYDQVNQVAPLDPKTTTSPASSGSALSKPDYTVVKSAMCAPSPNSNNQDASENLSPGPSDPAVVLEGSQKEPDNVKPVVEPTSHMAAAAYAESILTCFGEAVTATNTGEDMEFRCPHCTSDFKLRYRFYEHLCYHYHYRCFKCGHCPFLAFSGSSVFNHCKKTHHKKPLIEHMIKESFENRIERVMQNNYVHMTAPYTERRLLAYERAKLKKSMKVSKKQMTKKKCKGLTGKKGDSRPKLTLTKRKVIVKTHKVLKRVKPKKTPVAHAGITASGEEKWLQCPYCRAEKKTLKMIETEIRYHIHYKPFCCPYCELSSGSEKCIPRHIAKMHPKKKIKVRYESIESKEEKFKELLGRSLAMAGPTGKAKVMQMEKMCVQAPDDTSLGGGVADAERESKHPACASDHADRYMFFF